MKCCRCVRLRTRDGPHKSRKTPLFSLGLIAIFRPLKLSTQILPKSPQHVALLRWSALSPATLSSPFAFVRPLSLSLFPLPFLVNVRELLKERKGHRVEWCEAGEQKKERSHEKKPRVRVKGIGKTSRQRGEPPPPLTSSVCARCPSRQYRDSEETLSASLAASCFRSPPAASLTGNSPILSSFRWVSTN